MATKKKASRGLRRNDGPGIDDLERIVLALGDEELFGRAGLEFGWMLQREGFDLIGSGGTRIVVGLGDGNVAKIDASPGGPANAAEIEVWNEFGDQTDLLAPIIDERADGRIIVMPRADAFDGPVDSAGRGKAVPRKLRKALDAAKEDLLDLLGPGIEDPAYDFNWGLIDGMLACIDYAS
jgi:hypothetical protein